MSNLSYMILDVFAEKPYAGNQLAVFTDAAGITTERMQQIAREINYSETTFIMSKDHQLGIYEVRIFTPEFEVPFAGHPTLGTAYVIQNYLRPNASQSLTLRLKVGDIPVWTSKDANGQDLCWMRQIQPEFGAVLPAEVLAEVLGISVEDIDGDFPIEEVSTGFPHIIVPLKSLEAMKRIKVSKPAYFNLIEKSWGKNVQVFCPTAHDGGEGISTRNFTDYIGIPEDPATGSGNGCLAGYLVHHGYFDPDKASAVRPRHSTCGRDFIDLRSEQGYEIGRPSVLHLKARRKGDAIEIEVGGGVFPIARGEFLPY
jgi:trans-2,3-dihydro-3-hydroxyanthranilate isomerase